MAVGSISRRGVFYLFRARNACARATVGLVRSHPDPRSERRRFAIRAFLSGRFPKTYAPWATPPFSGFRVPTRGPTRETDSTRARKFGRSRCEVIRPSKMLCWGVPQAITHGCLISGHRQNSHGIPSDCRSRDEICNRRDHPYLRSRVNQNSPRKFSHVPGRVPRRRPLGCWPCPESSPAT